LVEPSPIPFVALQKLHEGNPRLSLLNCFVGASSQIVSAWMSDDGLSTTEQKRYELWSKAGSEFRSLSFAAQVSFSQLFFTFPMLYELEFVSIDTEGTSVQLLHSLMENLMLPKRRFPKVICVEHDGKIEEILSFCPQYASVYQNGENIVMVRK
jgi:predicted nucleotidyltransferase